tara:strand:- start:202 stop:513 length:312 start_codon:yes stop_codon:yes gene_type:complete
MNKAKKGYRKEYQARKELEKDGWDIVFKSTRNRFGTYDFAGLFDIVAINEINWLFISVKHFNGYYLPHQKEIKKFKEQFGKLGMIFALWLWEKKERRWLKIGI